jgi:hypothetical protein
MSRLIMKRRFFTILSAMSLIAGLALSAAWGMNAQSSARTRGYADETICLQHVNPLKKINTVAAIRLVGGEIQFALCDRVWFQDIRYQQWNSQLQRNAEGTGWYSPTQLIVSADATQMGPWGVNQFGQGFVSASGGDIRVDGKNQRVFHENFSFVQVPDWAIICGTLILPCAWVLTRLSYRAKLRMAHGLCATCGYDLRASGSRCPECGEVVMGKPGG